MAGCLWPPSSLLPMEVRRIAGAATPITLPTFVHIPLCDAPRQKHQSESARNHEPRGVFSFGVGDMGRMDEGEDVGLERGERLQS
jgi:hypothetical protein